MPSNINVLVRTASNNTNKLHEKALRIVCYDYNSKFEELLTKDGSDIDNRNI